MVSYRERYLIMKNNKNIIYGIKSKVHIYNIIIIDKSTNTTQYFINPINCHVYLCCCKFVYDLPKTYQCSTLTRKMSTHAIYQTSINC